MFSSRFILLWTVLISLPLQALSANVGRETLAVWANEAIIATYTYDYENFIARQQEIAHYFTAQAWIDYTNALSKAKLVETVQKKSYFVSAVATMPPTIEPLHEGYWRVTMPILVVYKNTKFQQKQNLEVTLIFSSSHAGEGVRGFTIESLRTKEIAPPCSC